MAKMAKINSRTTGRKKILIVDDHPLVRQGLSQLIAGEADLTVCGEAGDAETTRLTLAKGLPDLVLLDLSLPGANGFGLLKELHSRHPALPFLVLSMYDEELFAERVLRAGAKGYIEKKAPGSAVIEAIRTIRQGGLGVSPGVLLQMAKALIGSSSRQHSGVGGLSDRELEVYEALGRGQATSEVAAALQLSVKTVETHIGNIKRKFHLRNYAELVRHATFWFENERSG